jgi:hypothetical protein
VPTLSSEMLWNGQACCEADFLFVGSALESGIKCCRSYAKLLDHAFRHADWNLAPRMRKISTEGYDRDEYRLLMGKSTTDEMRVCRY